jgi:hypothetical protein
MSTSEAVAHFGTNARDAASCRVCGRTLLLGERSVGFFTERGEGPFEVCELCVPRAGRYGLRPKPSHPDEVLSSARRRHTLRRLWGRVRRADAVPASVDLTSAPLGSAALPVALASFNESAHTRTLAGLYKTLGEPRASVIPRSPTDREVILTVAWEIVWCQFRIMPEGTIEANRGTYISDLSARWREWNCNVLPSGIVTPPELDQLVAAPAVTELNREGS